MPWVGLNSEFGNLYKRRLQHTFNYLRQTISLVTEVAEDKYIISILLYN